MKVEEMSLCKNCVHEAVRMFTQEYERAKSDIRCIPEDYDFLFAINLHCRYFEKKTIEHIK